MFTSLRRSLEGANLKQMDSSFVTLWQALQSHGALLSESPGHTSLAVAPHRRDAGARQAQPHLRSGLRMSLARPFRGAQGDMGTESLAHNPVPKWSYSQNHASGSKKAAAIYGKGIVPHRPSPTRVLVAH